VDEQHFDARAPDQGYNSPLGHLSLGGGRQRVRKVPPLRVRGIPKRMESREERWNSETNTISAVSWRRPVSITILWRSEKNHSNKINQQEKHSLLKGRLHVRQKRALSVRCVGKHF
jgi:hypothetical protein